MGNRIRTFIALPVTDTVQKKLGNLQAAFDKENMPLRWVKPENIHLTLAFLGEVESHLIGSLGKVIEKIASDNSMMLLTVQGLGVFPTIRRPKVLWAGITEDTDRLTKLKRALDVGLEIMPELGYVPEKRPFKAHLTLARIKKVKRQLDARQLSTAMIKFQAGISSVMDIRVVCLMKSELTPKGAIYTEMKRVELGGPFSNDEKIKGD